MGVNDGPLRIPSQMCGLFGGLGLGNHPGMHIPDGRPTQVKVTILQMGVEPPYQSCIKVRTATVYNY